MRRFALLLVLVLLVSACGATSDDRAASASTAATASAGEAADTPGETDGVNEPKPIDFELALSDGSPFRLSDEQKPVYLVFWAEW